MKRCVLFCIAIMLLITGRPFAQDSYNERAQKYIQQYSSLAILEQKKNGIPAAITLGQGILETEAGASELMTEANNHFGIKCNNHWDGPTFAHTDDAPDECFKKYTCAAESYRDHSEHLKTNPRYSPLFNLSQTDYASWAVCLKKCGYATNPQYAQRLIKIIEDFKLQEYTYSALNNTSPVDFPAASAAHADIDLKDGQEDDSDKKTQVAEEKRRVDVDPIRRTADSARNFMNHLQEASEQDKRDSLANAISNNYVNSKLIVVNGLRAFYAYKDEMLLQYAIKFNVRYPKLLEMNDLPDAPLTFNTYVYVEKKLASGTHSHHAVKDGENLLMIAQTEGMQLKKLQALNLLNPGEEPATGSVLQLELPARVKPELAIKEAGAKKNTITTPAIIANVPIVKAAIVDKKASQDIADNKDAISTIKEETDTLDTEKEDLADSKMRQEKAVPGNTHNTIATDEPVSASQITPAAETKTGDGNSRYYMVKKGDTAFSIARRNNIPLDQLIQWNNLGDGGIMIGQTLRVKE